MNRSIALGMLLIFSASGARAGKDYSSSLRDMMEKLKDLK